MMEASSRRRRSNVVAGSVWESRMKMDQVKGGIKVFHGDDDQNSEPVNNNNSRCEQNPSGTLKEQRRKTWDSEPVIDPILIRKTVIIRSEESPEEFLDSTNDDENLRSDDDDDVNLEENPIPTREKSRIHYHKIVRDGINGDKDQLVVVKEEIKGSNTKPSEWMKPKENWVNNQIPKTSIPFITKLSPVKDQEKLQGFAETQNKYQSIVDIIMWRDMKVSSLVFGIGNLILLSPVINKDINFSLIPAISYAGLICIAAIFLYKAILNREPINLDDSNIIHSVGEEQAVCLVKVVLPWINMFILEIRHLLSGDPATTMKFAVSLFVLARLGSFITVWRVAVLGFLGVFSLPKFYSTYSRQLVEEGTLWLSQARNVWNSYTYTKVIVAVFFTLVWSSSSTVARVWEVFMLIVSSRYYQETLIQTTESERTMNELPTTKEEPGMESEWRALFC